MCSVAMGSTHDMPGSLYLLCRSPTYDVDLLCAAIWPDVHYGVVMILRQLRHLTLYHWMAPGDRQSSGDDSAAA